MSRLIDVDALGVGRCSKDVLPEAYCAWWNGLIDLIEKAPTVDAVPVVRCRECAEFEPNNGGLPFGLCLQWEQYTDGDGFCYRGKRKHDDHDG